MAIVNIQHDNFDELAEKLKQLVESRVLVGVTEDKTERKETDGPTNASIAYIQDNGSPALNIPARPFMIPGFENVQQRVEGVFKTGAQEILKGTGDANILLTKVGLLVQASIRRRINEGIPPPLSDRTLQERAASGKAVKGANVEIARRDEGLDASTEFAKPLVHTGQLRNSINFVIREDDGD